MKKRHIIGIIIIAVAIGSMIGLLNDSSTYSDFTEAAALKGGEVHVVGKLSKDKPLEYQPEVNANRFSFYMTDNKGIERRVLLLKGKPQDFERSEQIVVIGSLNGGSFIASDILMKCPSKYNDGKQNVAAQ
ncbi:MAG: hypothetical protein FD123_3586 [Bacteroidetes bacterium]|nr:MAG: hypothetical protein FD123_3586 [Bacteroidota bacterium]